MRLSIPERSISLAAAVASLLAVLGVAWGAGERPARAATPGQCIIWAGQCRFPTALDTMKLSKDKESAGLTDVQIASAVAAVAQQGVTHIVVDTHYDHPGVMYQWVKAIRAQGKHVWFRAGLEGWLRGTITPTQWLQTYDIWLRTYVNNPSYPNFFEKGDIFDPNPESENGYVAYCHCSLYGGTSWTTAFNQFLIDQTTIADQVFAAKGFNQTPSDRDILTTVHSVDPGTAVGVLNSSFLTAASNLVTVDAYPDQRDTDPTQAADAWLKQLGEIHATWPQASILIGEMGYSNAINVDDAQQKAVIAAEMQAFATTTLPLVGINYWVGPGSSTSGGYTYVLQGSVSNGWTPRPSAECLSAFFTRMQGGSSLLCPPATGTATPTSVGGVARMRDLPSGAAGVSSQPRGEDPPWQRLLWVGLGAVLTLAVGGVVWFVRARAAR